MLEVLRLADGFEFLAVQVGDARGGELLREALAKELERDGVHLVGTTLGVESTVAVFLDELRAAPQRRVFLFWCEDDLGDFFSLLNQKRDVVAEIAKSPLILVMHAQIWSTFRRHAPDFWSIHHAVLRFSAGRPVRHVWRRTGLEKRAPGAPSMPPSSSGRRVSPAELAQWRDVQTLVHSSEARLLTAALHTRGTKILVRGSSALVRGSVAQVGAIYPNGIWWIDVDRIPESGPRIEDRACSILADLLDDLFPGTLLRSRPHALRGLYQIVTRDLGALFVFEHVESPELLEWLLPGQGVSAVVTSLTLAGDQRFDKVITLPLVLDDAPDINLAPAAVAQTFGRALSDFDQVGDLDALAETYYDMGDLAFKRGDLDEADRCYRDTLALS
jgi:hypothetical protein